MQEIHIKTTFAIIPNTIDTKNVIKSALENSNKLDTHNLFREYCEKRPRYLHTDVYLKYVDDNIALGLGKFYAEPYEDTVPVHSMFDEDLNESDRQAIDRILENDTTYDDYEYNYSGYDWDDGYLNEQDEENEKEDAGQGSECDEKGY